MNVLITGGLGYIGSRIATHLSVIPGYRVSVTTRKRPSDTVAYQVPTHIHIIHEAFALNEAMERAISESDIIIHLAALNEIDSVKNPSAAIAVNVMDSFSILESAIRHGVKKFIYFSTAHIYGAPLKGLITEEIVPRPVHPYALTHRAFEDFVCAAGDNKKINAIVLRLSNSFGPPSFLSADRWTLLVNDLCRQAASKQQMKLNSAGLQQRDFITLLDVCRSVDFFINTDKEKLPGDIFNLGGDNAMRIIDMANLVKERFYAVTGNKIELSVPEATDAELKTDYFLRYDVGKLFSAGFTLKNNVTEEIDNTIIFCNKHFS